ncbi:MAG: dehydrogenase [Haloplasmataceae bacterium]|nr:dehydrogenase [Haloplasmataceae bacterium]
MVNKNYGLAIVGLGGMGNWHREFVKTIEGITVVGIYDIKESRRQFAKENNEHVYESLDDLLNDKKVDIVLVATPNDLHKEISIKALRAGKNVVCEKPAMMNSKEFEEVMSVQKETGKLFVVHQNRRWDEDFLTIKEIYNKNTLGKIYSIESRVHGSRGIPGDWRQEKEHGGGMLLDWGVHIIDQLLFMIDEKVKKVYCKFTHVTNELVDDGFRIILTFESGLTVLLEVGTSNFISLPRWYVLGINGSAVINGWDLNGKIVRVKNWEDKDAVPIRAASGITKTMAPRQDNTIFEEKLPIQKSELREYYRNVIATIEGKAEIIVKNSEVLRVIKLMEACTVSDEKETVVDFE